MATKCLSYRPFINCTSQKKKHKKPPEINQQLEAVYTGRDKATVANHFMSVLGVCNIDKKNNISIFSGILSIKIIRRYFAECVIVLISADSYSFFDILHILFGGQFTAVIETNIFQ